MKNSQTIRTALAFTAAFACASGNAASFRAYLSSTGSDANPCTVNQPCRLLPAALNAIVDGGEVWMLDSANFNSGPVNVTKSVSILAIPGAVGSVVALGGPAINIATAGVNVSLRNLLIVPFPASGGTGGIVMTNGNSLTILETVIANLPDNGIDVNANSSTTLRVVDSVIRNNGNFGVHLRGGATADIANSRIFGNYYGVLVEGTGTGFTTAAVNDTVISGNYVGLHALSEVSGATARWTAIRTTASNNSFGFGCQSGTGTTSCTAGHSMASGNSVAGFYQYGGAPATFRSLGNNVLIDNANNNYGTITLVAGG
jgi:hypothetical protein